MKIRAKLDACVRFYSNKSEYSTENGKKFSLIGKAGIGKTEEWKWGRQLPAPE
jgi:flagellar biosynthesis GTPase FlhF